MQCQSPGYTFGSDYFSEVSLHVVPHVHARNTRNGGRST